MLSYSKKGIGKKMVVMFDRFSANDAYSMNWIEKDVFKYHLEQSPQFFHMLETQGNSYTMFGYVGARPIVLGIITLDEQTPKHCYLNMFMSTDIQTRFCKEILKGLRNFVHEILGSYQRVSMDGKTSNVKLAKLCKSLGFTAEGVMRKFGFDGEDYTLFARVKE